MSKRAEEAWERKQFLIQREMSKKGLKGRITAHCIDCCYDPLDEGTWRQQIGRCAISKCPLFDVRPLPSTNFEEEVA